jgi:hypothetical protein
LSATWIPSSEGVPDLHNTTANISLGLAGGDLTSLLSSNLAPDTTWVVSVSGDLVNFGPSDFGRCYLYSGSSEISHTSTIVGSPSASGAQGPAGLVAEISLIGVVAVGSSVGTVTLECSHDHTETSVAPYFDAGGTLLATETTRPSIVTNSSNVALSQDGLSPTTVLSTELAAGTYMLSASGDLVNFGASDYGRCEIYVAGVEIANTSTIIGNPSASGDSGPAGILGGVSLSGAVTVGSGGAAVDLVCSHDDNDVSTVPYFDAGGALLAVRVPSATQT